MGHTARAWAGILLLVVLGVGCGLNPLDEGTEVAGLVMTPTPVPLPTLPTGVDPFDAESVKTWQQVLVALGHEITPDGVYGQETLDATAALQADLGLEVTGTVDPATLFAVSLTWPPDGTEATPTAAAPPTPEPEPSPTETLAVPTPSDGTEVALSCSDITGAALPHRTEFLVSVANPGQALEFGIDYGDGSQYIATDWTDAQLNGHVHSYGRSGLFNVRVWVTWADGGRSTADCLFDLSRGDGNDTNAPSTEPADPTPEPEPTLTPQDLGEDNLPTGPAGG